jgi:predicted dehydrogenase
MKTDKLLFVGLGGAGQRHLRIFHQLKGSAAQYFGYRQTGKTPTLNSDFSVNPQKSLEDLYQLKLLGTLEAALSQKPDLVVISNPTSMHFEVAKKAIEAGCHVLVEKPLSHELNGTSELLELAAQKKLRLLTSFQRRFNPAFVQIKKHLETHQSKIMSAHFNIFSHVPDWHKYEDFKDLYACQKKLGGGVLLTEIHEIDLCCWFFGLPEAVYCTGGNFSEHQMDVEDTISMILHYPHFHLSFSMSFMNKSTERNFFIKTQSGEIKWSEQNNHLSINEPTNVINQSYSDFTMNHFFEAQAKALIADTIPEIQTDAFNALSSLQVVDAAKKSMASGKKEFINRNKNA